MSHVSCITPRSDKGWVGLHLRHRQTSQTRAGGRQGSRQQAHLQAEGCASRPEIPEGSVPSEQHARGDNWAFWAAVAATKGHSGVAPRALGTTKPRGALSL